jgi:hypothetical protein
MTPIEVVRKTYPLAEKVQIFQICHKRMGWTSYGEGELPGLTLNRLVQLIVSGHTMVSLRIHDEEGYRLASASDFHVREFFEKKTLTIRNPADNSYNTFQL